MSFLKRHKKPRAAWSLAFDCPQCGESLHVGVGDCGTTTEPEPPEPPDTGGDFAITEVTGTLSHNGTVTIAGAQFGTKPTAGPQKYDDFESGTLGQPVSGWGTFCNVSANVPSYSDARLRTHSSRSLRARFPSAKAGCSSFLYELSPRSETLYLDYWQYFDDIAMPQNLKTFRVYGSSENLPDTTWNIGGGTNRRVTSEWEGGGLHQTDTGEGAFADAWHHYQFWMVMSDAGAANGRMWMVRDGQVRIDATTWRFRGSSGGDDQFHSVYFGYYGWEAAKEYFNYFDQCYVDTTPQRVELGDDADYARCSHREIQIPTAWSASSITIKLKTGTFSSGPAYLFVVDEDNRPTAGYAVTLA